MPLSDANLEMEIELASGATRELLEELRERRAPDASLCIPGPVFGQNVRWELKTGVVEMNLPCEACGIVFAVTFYPVGDPPYTLRGVPCTNCGQTFTVEYPEPPE